MSILWLVAAGLVVYLYLREKAKSKRLQKCSDQIPGPKPWPFIGNALEFASDSTGIFSRMQELSAYYGSRFRIWNNGRIYVVCSNPKDVERVLVDNKNITKSDFYRFIIPWIGYGLLTSTGAKWKKHRKIITPTFFFKILEDFLEVFNKNSVIMCENLEKEVGKNGFDVFPYVNRAALDNICETAMGVDFNVQRTKESSYLRSVKTICATAILRVFKVWLMPDIVFSNSSYGKSQKEAIEFIHKTTVRVIKQKREQLEKKKNGETIKEENDDGGERKKTAFLDLLVESAGAQLTDEEINDEVNTFMFEGHDTISSGLSFALYSIANNQDVQEKLHQEITENLTDPNVTMREINALPYLEMVIKETLRLFPSVPMIGRELEEDVTFSDGIVVPKGGNIVIDFYALHRDPEVWSDPLKFDPENFSADKEKRHPFAYVPFSAGSRNCIGQKFALLEMKSVISHIVRRFKLLPSENPDHKLKITNELVLISRNGQNIRLQKRD